MSVRGENNPQAKLTNEDVISIRKLRSEGVLEKQLAWQFGVSRSVITKVVARKSWKHVL